MEKFEKVNHRLLGEHVESQLKDYILTTPVNVGDKIPTEFELADMFGVGRSTIREAVKGLVTKGMLEVRRGSGTYVISTQTLDEDPLSLSRYSDKYKLALELLDVRLMLEPEIAALAALHSTEEEKVRLVTLCEAVEENIRKNENHLPNDVKFHEYIAKCSRNRVVETLIPIISTAVITFGNLTYRKLLDESVRSHRSILNAILAGDSVGARCAMVSHLSFNREYLRSALNEKSKTSDVSE
ncbi:FadR/GntR family transcriptional regulator [Ruminococcus sp.]|uniref:FadR/GntR family transcriptional regulator n=1 Tax=Ruminococcus sp. TaxID=41978 RepID=UPI002E803B39|nr:FadR/GntR family transcriptional regulator [Ruminococcus sp.]MEE3493477.1 FadR/GntR family transcriptional regulator [Ruminococcus sp.]